MEVSGSEVAGEAGRNEDEMEWAWNIAVITGMGFVLNIMNYVAPGTVPPT